MGGKIIRTVYDKILFSFIAAVFFITLLSSAGNFYMLHEYGDEAIDMYEDTLELYGNYWSQRLKSIDRSILTMNSMELGRHIKTICEEDDQLKVEISKVQSVDLISQNANIYENQFRYFIYIPVDEIFLQSANGFGSYNEDNKCEEYLRKNIEEIQKESRQEEWTHHRIEENDYLIHAYYFENIYIGAVIKCDVIADYIMEDNESMKAMAIVDSEKNIVYCSDEKYRKKTFEMYSENLKGTKYNIGAIVDGGRLNTQANNLYMIIFISFIFSVSVAVISINFQRKEVWIPLKKLNRAMGKFSQGNLDFRLEDMPENKEIKGLFYTFNSMVSEIKSLKINVYEKEIEKQKVKNQYFRVQLQPHFYSNILNLIYGLAEVKDYVSIQKLAIHLMGYFRYLMSTKDDFVLLKQELMCVQDYIEIQELRYMDNFSVNVECKVDPENVKVPPLLIQTFVENSIKHNILTVSKLLVSVCIVAVDKTLEITITDNGVGFPEEIRGQLEKGESVEEQGKHVGIENIMRRIEGLYGDAGNIDLINLKVGAKIRIRIPMMKETEDEHIDS